MVQFAYRVDQFLVSDRSARSIASWSKSLILCASTQTNGAASDSFLSL